MKIYNFHPVSGDFMQESFADESPLESGVYLIPAHATVIAPPEFDKNSQICKWVGTVEEGSWQIMLFEEAKEKSEPLMFEPTKEEVEANIQRDLEIVQARKDLLKKLGMSDEDIEKFLLIIPM